MDKFLVAALLGCMPGDRLVDWSALVPHGITSIDLLIHVEPAYARFLIYASGHRETIQRCCGGKTDSILHVAIGDGKFCVGQSQPQMKWSVRAILRPSVDS